MNRSRSRQPSRAVVAVPSSGAGRSSHLSASQTTSERPLLLGAFGEHLPHLPHAGGEERNLVIRCDLFECRFGHSERLAVVVPPSSFEVGSQEQVDFVLEGFTVLEVHLVPLVVVPLAPLFGQYDAQSVRIDRLLR